MEPGFIVCTDRGSTTFVIINHIVIVIFNTSSSSSCRTSCSDGCVVQRGATPLHLLEISSHHSGTPSMHASHHSTIQARARLNFLLVLDVNYSEVSLC